jgi:D-arabinose 1-dehydrogenase-like Zn-dependent alcohol dehydrogenase
VRAVQFDEFGGPVEVRVVEDPQVPDDGAIIRVEATGLCRSDWHGWMGHDADIRLPHVPGHEFAGTIEAVGRGVRRWRPGIRVTFPFVGACGACPACAAGDEQVCLDQDQPGFHRWGSFAEHVAIARADVNLVALPDEMDAVTAASLGCRFATAYRAVMAQGRVAEGDWVAVHGCGGVGLSAVMIAVAAGARVVAVDVSPSALGAARSLGAEVLIDAREGDAAAAVEAVTDGGANLSLDAFGSPDASLGSIRSLRRRGRHVQVGLLVGAESSLAVPMDRVLSRELELVGSHGMAARDYPEMLARVADGRLRPDLLVGRTISLAEAPEALVAMARPAASPGMTVIRP